MDLYGLEECPIAGLMEQAVEIETKRREAADKVAAELAQLAPGGDGVPVAPPGGFAPASSSGPMVPLGDVVGS